jgi:hypothetical protein
MGMLFGYKVLDQTMVMRDKSFEMTPGASPGAGATPGCGCNYPQAMVNQTPKFGVKKKKKCTCGKKPCKCK